MNWFECAERPQLADNGQMAIQIEGLLRAGSRSTDLQMERLLLSLNVPSLREHNEKRVIIP